MVEDPSGERDYWAQVQAERRMRAQRIKTLTAEAYCSELGEKGLLFRVAAGVFSDVVRPGTSELVWSGYSWEPDAIGDVEVGETTFALSMNCQTNRVELEVYDERKDAMRPSAPPGMIGVILKLDSRGKVRLDIREEDGVWMDLGGRQGGVLEVLTAIRDSFRVATDQA